MTESYRRWRLPQLWEMVAADNVDDAHLHLATLRRQQTVLETQRDRLRVLRDQLAEAWPPEKSEAAKAFLQRINDMIRAMSLTASGAADVRTNLNLIIDSILQARTNLAPLVEEYQRTVKVPDQRVGEHARKMLDERARRILVATDAAVVEPSAGLQVFLPAYKRISLQAEVPGPPVTAAGSSSKGSVGGGLGRSAGHGFPSPRFDPPEPTVEAAPDGMVQLAGAGLDGTGHVLTSSVPGVVDGSRPASVPLFGPGRVLGATPLSGPGVPHGGGSASGVPMRGLVGGAAGGVTPGGRAGGTTAARGPVVHPASRAGPYRDSSFEEYANRRRTVQGMDESWSAPQGVSPVIEPPDSRPHDPGPGVFGIDR
jgi:hypothetical protein